MPVNVLWPVRDLYKGDNLFIGISYISAVLKKHGFGSEVVEADLKALRARLKSGGSHILAFSTPTIYARTYADLNRRLKREFQYLAVFGGPHPSFFPEFIEEDGIDVVCRGEGEYAMLDLVRSVDEGRSCVAVENLWVKDDGSIRRNPLRPLVDDLDTLPLPDHEIFRTALPSATWQAFVITARGCPYSCTYCFNHAFREMYRGKGKIVRRRSVDHVMEELKAIKRRKNYRYIRFGDDLFTLSPEWVEEFAAKYRDNIGLPFSCMIRANHITPEMARMLKSAGCWRVQMGVESGDEEIRNTIFKRGMSEEEIIRAASIVKSAGLKLLTGNVLGAPGATLEKDLKTLALNMKIKPAFCGVTLLQPYPRTEIHDIAVRMGLLDGPTPDIDERTLHRDLKVKFVDPKEKLQIENLQKLFFIPVEWPWTLGLVKRMIRWRAKRLYHFIFSQWILYCRYFRVIPPRIGWMTIFKRWKAYSVMAAAWDALTRSRIKPQRGDDRRGGESS